MKEHEFVERIYKMTVDIGNIAYDDIDKHVKNLIKKFKSSGKFDESRQKVFVITNRQDITNLQIITTYYDQNTNQYYTLEY